MLKFEDLVKALDKDIRVEIYKIERSGIVENLIYNGLIKNLKEFPDCVYKLCPQRTSREIYLEIYTY